MIIPIPGLSYGRGAGLVAKRGIAVLGKYPGYVEMAEQLGAKYFNISSSAWARMSKPEQWAANRQFLDYLIKQGDNIILSTPVKKVEAITGSFRQELDYLLSKGYKLSSDGTHLIK
jgi:hypothetical protein